jgi:hypothetical protein
VICKFWPCDSTHKPAVPCCYRGWWWW